MVTAVVAPGGGPRNHSQLKGGLSSSRRQLVELMQKINFGRLEGVRVRDAEPILEPLPGVVREIKFGGENGPRPEFQSGDFALKSQVVELFRTLDDLRAGVIDVLEIKYGLPFRMIIREVTA